MTFQNEFDPCLRQICLTLRPGNIPLFRVFRLGKWLARCPRFSHPWTRPQTSSCQSCRRPHGHETIPVGIYVEWIVTILCRKILHFLNLQTALSENPLNENFKTCRQTVFQMVEDFVISHISPSLSWLQDKTFLFLTCMNSPSYLDPSVNFMTPTPFGRPFWNWPS